MKRAAGWLVGFLLGLACTLALARPENLRRTLVLYPVAFWGFFLGVRFRLRLRDWRDRRRAERARREFQARNLSLFVRRNDRR